MGRETELNSAETEWRVKYWGKLVKKVLKGGRGGLVSVTGPSVFVNCFLFRLDSIFPPRWEVRGTMFLGAFEKNGS